MCGRGVGKIQQPAVLLHTLRPGPASGTMCHLIVICSVPTVSCEFSALTSLLFSFHTSAFSVVRLNAPHRAFSHVYTLYLSLCLVSHTHIGVRRSSPLTSTHSISSGTGGLDRLSCLPLYNPSPHCHISASFPQGLISKSTWRCQQVIHPCEAHSHSAAN